jgi:hypothetical protein
MGGRSFGVVVQLNKALFPLSPASLLGITTTLRAGMQIMPDFISTQNKQ